MTGRVVALEGPSGGGKTTVAAALRQRTGWTVVPEAFERLHPRPTLAIPTVASIVALETRLLREEARRFQDARVAAAAEPVVIADTGFLGPLTYTLALVRLRRAPSRALTPLLRLADRLAANGRWGPADLHLLLRTSEATRRRRLASDPTGHPAEFRERHESAGREESRMFREQLARRFPAQFRELDGRGTPREVAARVERAIRAAGPASARRAEFADLRRVLALP